jgi:hypothetical protein
MRASLIIPLLLVASAARADGTKYTPLVDVKTVEPGCRVAAEVPQSAIIASPMFDAAVSTASCIAAHTHRLVLTPTADSVTALDVAIAPAMQILDRVIATGDAEHVLIAQYTKLEILQNNVVRLFMAIPPLTPQLTVSELGEHHEAVQATDTLTRPWRDRAMTIRRAIALLVYQHPSLATRDPLLAYMVAHSRIADAAGIATR